MMGRRERKEGKRGRQFISLEVIFAGFQSKLWLWTHTHAPPPTHSPSEVAEKILENVFYKLKDCFIPLNRNVVGCLTATELPCAV